MKLKINKLRLWITVTAILSINGTFAQNFINGLQGSGTEEDPVLITSADDLRLLSAFVMNDADYSMATANKHFKLTADIFFGEPCYDFDGNGVNESNFIPIGGRMDTLSSSDYRLFQGIFHGDGHMIYNLKIKYTGVPYVGLFGVTWGATIEELGIENGEFSGAGCVAALCGQANYGSTINSCCVRRSKVTGNDMYVGGLCGGNYSNSIINNCYVQNLIPYNMILVTGTVFVGGFCGFNSPNSVISNSYSTALVYTTASSPYYGGFCGYATESTSLSNVYYYNTWNILCSSVQSDLYSQGGTSMTGDELMDSNFITQLNNNQNFQYFYKGDTSNSLCPILYWQNKELNSIVNIQNNDISIYPNPVTNKLFIETEYSNNITILVYDLFGRVILQYENTNPVDVSSLSVGSYLISVKQNGKLLTQKQFIKK